ncbi:MAG: hypothetical protein D6725_08850 [Planctomycetota bacterium]|nr:MAG: hypothetical protein D6725_08850 [Planctomycetota bacterium]
MPPSTFRSASFGCETTDVIRRCVRVVYSEGGSNTIPGVPNEARRGPPEKKVAHTMLRPFRRPLAVSGVLALLGMLLGASKPATSPRSSVLANSWRGFQPGVATREDVVGRLGPAPIETRRSDDLRYPSEGRPGLNDRLYFRDGRLALVTSASVDARYPDRAAIVERLGEPEHVVRFVTQEYLDYSEHGLRFICDKAGRTIGTIHFEPRRRRVPADYPNARIDLRRAAGSVAPADPPAEFRVGAAQVSISPQRLDDLTASGAAARLHVAQDLKARAAIFKNAQTTIVFLGLDVFGLGPWDVAAIREELSKRGYRNVILAMSHTHANVDTIGFYGYYPARYAGVIRERAVSAVLKAAENLRPIRELRLGSVEMPLAGGRVVDLVRNARDPGLLDPTVSIVQAIGRDGRPVLNLIHLACHPEVIRLEETRGLSPDYVGTLCEEVSRRLGGQTVFLNGALGGMVTPDTRFRTQQAAERMGRRLAEFVVQAARRAEPSGSYRLWRLRRTVVYPITGETVRAFLQDPPRPVDLYQGRFKTEMNAVWVGDAQFITVPGELLPDIGLEIVSHMKGRLRIIVGLANDELGYLVPSFDFRVGHYEERTGPGAAGGEITRSVGLQLAPLVPAE